MDLQFALLLENERFDRKMNEHRQIFLKKINSTYFFFSKNKEISFFIQIKIEKSKNFESNGNISFANLIDKRRLKMKILLNLIDPTGFFRHNEYYTNALIHVLKDNNINLKKEAECKYYAFNQHGLIRDPAKVELGESRCKIMQKNEEIYAEIMKIGPGDIFKFMH